MIHHIGSHVMNALVVLGLVALALAGCASAYDAPSAHGGAVDWIMVPPQEVGTACGHPGDLRVVGCALTALRPCVIVTRPPQAGDTALADVLGHEVAHCQGWRHPRWQTGEG